MQGNRSVAVRGCVMHCLRDPGESGDANAVEVFEDGVLVVDGDRVAAVGPAPDLLPTLAADCPVEDTGGAFIVPGFVDTHVHYPQTDIIASHGAQLLDWLERYTFPAEAAFADAAVAADTAAFFLDELLRNGTTSALVFATVHPGSVDAVLEAAREREMRLVAGKVLMDRNAPEVLTDTAESGYRESARLIERWHGSGRLGYAITPRFAPTSSERQLELAGRLAREHPDVYVHTHLAENLREVQWVAELFANSRSYLDVYDHYGLVCERAVFAHCIHLDDRDRLRMAEAGAAAAHCPTSNLFLGSGLFDYAATRACGVCTGLATDVGGGTSFSMLRTAAEAYKVAQMTGTSLSPERLLYMATLAGAEALRVADRIGRFRPGMEADFVVLDRAATPLQLRRQARAGSPLEALFALLILGDERNIASTWVNGRPAWRRPPPVSP